MQIPSKPSETVRALTERTCVTNYPQTYRQPGSHYTPSEKEVHPPDKVSFAPVILTKIRKIPSLTPLRQTKSEPRVSLSLLRSLQMDRLHIRLVRLHLKPTEKIHSTVVPTKSAHAGMSQK